MKKTIVMIATMIACVALNAVNAAPLPEAKPDDVGFSQQGLALLWQIVSFAVLYRIPESSFQ